MKKSKKIISVLLATVMMFSAIGCTTFAFADDGKSSAVTEAFNKGLTKTLEVIIKGVLSGLNLTIKDNPSFVKETEYELKDFYAGSNGNFVTEAGEDYVWKLGSSYASLLPENLLTKKHYIGGFIGIENGFTNKIEDVADDMRVRTIALDDNSGRGVSLFATVDCIGMTNNDIKVIRRLVAETFAKEYPEVTLASINVFSTHCHSCIDTEGLWTNLFGKLFGNLVKSALNIPMETGTDPEYMEFMSNKVAAAMVDAFEKMEEGKLTYSVKDIGSGYFNNKNRSSCSSLDTRLTRLVFTPFDKTVRPTMIVNLGAHPDVAGLPMSDGVNKGRTVSGDYVYYLGEYINSCGYDFMFFNGAICGIYFGRGLTNDDQPMTYRWEQSRRYGYEIAKMALSMNKTIDEIKADPTLYNQAEIDAEIANCSNPANYTLWCENWTPVEEVEVEPFLNIRLATTDVTINNPLIKMAVKLNMANYSVMKTATGKYKSKVEIGYIEFGNQLKVCMVPGEFCADLVKGGNSLTAEGSFSGEAFNAPTLADLFGEDVTVFGLANDAIGYIVPDNDYSLGIINDHYQELISVGDETASAIMNGFALLKANLK